MEPGSPKPLAEVKTAPISVDEASLTQEWVAKEIHRVAANSTPEAFLAALKAEEQARWMRIKARIYVWGPILAGLLGGGTFLGFRIVPDAVKPVDVQETVETRVNQIETTLSGCSGRECSESETKQSIQGKIDTLGRDSVERKIQTVDGFKYIGDKIDAAHPKQVDAVEKPETLQAVEKQVDKIKKAAAVDEFFQGQDLGDGEG